MAWTAIPHLFGSHLATIFHTLLLTTKKQIREAPSAATVCIQKPKQSSQPEGNTAGPNAAGPNSRPRAFGS